MNTINQKEVEFFSENARHWDDQTGPFKGLYAMNPARLEFIKQEVCRYFSISSDQSKPFANLSICDVGSGGGILAEPLARLGGRITGMDASKEAINFAKEKSKSSGLSIEYLEGHPGIHPELANTFDVVISLEVIEHVDHPGLYIKDCASLVKPGGLLIVSTINRTLKSWGLAIVIAENVLKLAPKGAHTWDKFITPEELSQLMREAEIEPIAASGMSMGLIGGWKLSGDLSMNYIISGKKIV